MNSMLVSNFKYLSRSLHLKWSTPSFVKYSLYTATGHFIYKDKYFINTIVKVNYIYAKYNSGIISFPYSINQLNPEYQYIFYSHWLNDERLRFIEFYHCLYFSKFKNASKIFGFERWDTFLS